MANAAEKVAAKEAEHVIAKAVQKAGVRDAEKVAVKDAEKTAVKDAEKTATKDAEKASRPSRAYNRKRDYGGAQTDSPAGRRARQAAEGKNCPECNEPMRSGTPTQPVPEHNPPLVEHYYEHGGHAMTDAERRAYARSDKAIDGAACRTCQSKQGAEMARKSRGYKKRYGL